MPAPQRADYHADNDKERNCGRHGRVLDLAGVVSDLSAADIVKCIEGAVDVLRSLEVCSRRRPRDPHDRAGGVFGGDES